MYTIFLFLIKNFTEKNGLIRLGIINYESKTSENKITVLIFLKLIPIKVLR